ncbi:MAG: helix-turn-helix domain-containing protein [Pseudomonadota bacterium]
MSEIRPETETAILRAAFAVFSQNAGASLADVARVAGVGRATLHRHFAGRAELMVALAKEANREIETAVDAAVADAATYTEGLRLALSAMIPLAERYMFLASEPVEQDPELAALYARDLDSLVEDIDAAKAEGTFDPHIPSIWIAKTYDNLVYAGWSMVRDQDATPGQAADFAWRVLTCGASKEDTQT